MNFNQIIEHNYPFQHWEIIDCLDKKTLDEISFASIPDGERAYDGTRAADHSGEGKDGKLRLFITKDNAKSFPQLTKVINTLQEFETSQQISKILNKDLSASFVRLEIIGDKKVFWLNDNMGKINER